LHEISRIGEDQRIARQCFAGPELMPLLARIKGSKQHVAVRRTAEAKQLFRADEQILTRDGFVSNTCGALVRGSVDAQRSALKVPEDTREYLQNTLIP